MPSFPTHRAAHAVGLAGACLLLTAATAAPAPAQAAPPADALKRVASVEGITEYRLPNGLRVLLFPDPSRPLVTVNLTVFCGSRHEGYGETGMAHLLEHMLFKGTPLHPNVPKALRDHGANFNGTTWVDRTNYFETMPASDENLEFGIRLEADRMVNSFVKREDLLSEMTVVRNEFEQGENSPERVLSQRMLAVAYEWHNYGKSTIGNRSDIERVPIDNLRAFYRKYYRPDNAMLVVAGKFDEAKAKEYVNAFFGPVKNPDSPLPNTYTSEPAQDGERVVTLRRVGSVGAVGAVYHIPAGPHPDFPAVEVLEDILTSEPNGRLFKALVQSGKATSLSGSAFAWHDPAVLEVTASAEAGKLDEARETLIRTLENLAETPITEEEVERSKRKFAKLTEQVSAQTGILAVRLSEWAACGDWRLYFLHRDRIAAVTAADVNRAAATYLTRSNRTAGVYTPTDKPARAEIPESPAVAKMVEGYAGKAALAAGEAFDPTPENLDARLKRGKIGETFEFGTLARKTRGETVTLALTLRFGNAESLAGKNAAVELLGPTLRLGTTKHDRQRLSDELDKLGARVSVTSGLGSLGVSVQAKRATLPATLELVREILREPAFPADEFDILKRERRDAVEKQRTEPNALASTLLRRTIAPYPPTDVRYAPTIEEELARVDAVTLEQVKELYQTQLGGAIGQLAVVGDGDLDAAVESVRKTLSGWTTDVPFKPIDREVTTLDKGVRAAIRTPDKPNAVYMAGQVYAMKDSDPDYAAIVVGNYLLGSAPLASRLSNRVRGKEGLSYGVGSQTQAGSREAAAQFMIFAITNPENIRKVDAAVADELKKFHNEGVSLGELNEGKRSFLESIKVRRAGDAAIAGSIVENLYVGRTFAHQAELERRIEALTPEQVKAAFRKYLPVEKLSVVEAGDFPAK